MGKKQLSNEELIHSIRLLLDELHQIEHTIRKEVRKELELYRKEMVFESSLIRHKLYELSLQKNMVYKHEQLFLILEELLLEKPTPHNL